MSVIRCKCEKVIRGAGESRVRPFHVITLSLYHAFTLIEMLVSLAVLSVALAVVGVVFTVTTKTASQSAAYSETHNWVRQFVQQIDEDLRYVDPANSVSRTAIFSVRSTKAELAL